LGVSCDTYFFCYIARIKLVIMQQVAEMTNKKGIGTPSWLDLRIAEKLKMTIEEQEAYRKLHWNEIQTRVKALDERLEKCEVLISDEDEIANMVSKDRREHYEKSLGH